MRNRQIEGVLAMLDPPETERLVARLLAIESHEGAPGGESRVAGFMLDHLKRHGISAELIPVIGDRCNLIARIAGTGGGPVLLFNGHMDTVPPNAMKDAFAARIDGDRLHGRGACDMKGALAAMMQAMIAVRKSGAALKGDLVLAATIGEESDSPGAYHLSRSGVRADCAIVGEATGLKVAVAHKGIMWGEAVFEGHAVHGSVPDKGVNAIYHASRWIEAVRRSYIPSIALRKHPLLGNPTMNVGAIAGGAGPSTVPARCSVRFDRRMIPGENAGGVLEELRGTLDALAMDEPALKAVVSEMTVFAGVPHPPLDSGPVGPLVDVLLFAHEEETGERAVPCGLPYWTDGALLAGIPGIQIVVCGPGNIEQAHSDDEWVSRRELHAAARMYLHAAVRICGR